MVSKKTGDILNEQADVLVNTVNCVGVMGKGIALEFKKRFPANYKEYRIACERNEVVPGQIFVHETGQLYPRYIFNFPTKRHWRGKSKIEDIESGLNSLTKEVKRLNVSSIAIPPLGSGLGGLEWSEVLTIIEKHLNELGDVDVTVYEPHEPSKNILSHNIDVPNMTSGRAAFIVLIDKYLAGGLDPLITILEAQKLMYFLQVAGEPLQLQYEKAEFGPYSPSLSKVLHELEGHYIAGYGTDGNKPDKQISLIPGALDDANNVLKVHTSTQNHINKVTDLIEGFETSSGIELLASTHWIIKNEKPSIIDEVFQQFRNWNKRKADFTKHQITIAYEVLKKKGWVTL